MKCLAHPVGPPGPEPGGCVHSPGLSLLHLGHFCKKSLHCVCSCSNINLCRYKGIAFKLYPKLKNVRPILTRRKLQEVCKTKNLQRTGNPFHKPWGSNKEQYWKTGLEWSLWARWLTNPPRPQPLISCEFMQEAHGYRFSICCFKAEDIIWLRFLLSSPNPLSTVFYSLFLSTYHIFPFTLRLQQGTESHLICT